MKVAVIYDSRTGNTRAAAEQVAKAYGERGHEVSLLEVAKANPEEVARADVLCLGSWTQGLFVILQHPTAATTRFAESLPSLAGKDAVVFCSYRVSPGRLLPKLGRLLAGKGARVAASLAFRGRTPPAGFAKFAEAIAPAAPRPRAAGGLAKF